jgi:TRAP-type C4-dicarboxylate transport system permease small subunit
VAKMWHLVETGIKAISKAGAYVSAVCMGIIMVLATLDIMTSKFFGFSIPGSAELIEQLNVPLVFMGIAFVQLERGHMRVDVLDNYLPAIFITILKYAGYLLAMFTCFIMSWRAATLTGRMIETGELSQGLDFLPLWPFTVSLSLGCALLFIVYIFIFINELTHHEEEQPPQDTFTAI